MELLGMFMALLFVVALSGAAIYFFVSIRSKVLVTAIFIVAVLAWFPGGYLFDMSALLSYFGIIILALLLRKKNDRKYFITLFALNIVFVVYSTLAYKNFRTQINEYFSSFNEKYSCAPSIHELLQSDSGWEVWDSDRVVKKFTNWGGSYELRYYKLKDGRGRLADEENIAIKGFPECPPATKEPAADKEEPRP